MSQTVLRVRRDGVKKVLEDSLTRLERAWAITPRNAELVETGPDGGFSYAWMLHQASIQ